MLQTYTNCYSDGQLDSSAHTATIPLQTMQTYTADLYYRTYVADLYCTRTITDTANLYYTPYYATLAS